MDGHVEWALHVGETETRRHCVEALTSLEQTFADSARARSTAGFPHLKNARMMLVGDRPEPIRGHLDWARKASDEQFKNAVQKEIAQIRSTLNQMYRPVQ